MPSDSPLLRAMTPREPGWLSRLLIRNRRRAPRLMDVAGFARIEGVLVRVGDLSAGGMRLLGYRGLLEKQDRFDFTLSVVCPGEGPGGQDLSLEIEGQAVVAWRMADRMGAAFYSLDDAAQGRIQVMLALLRDRLEP